MRLAAAIVLHFPFFGLNIVTNKLILVIDGEGREATQKTTGWF
jgi:hypothetical protein